MKAGFRSIQVKGQRFEGIMEIQAKLQAVLEIIMTWKFQQQGRDAGPGV
jgi:hypothetical protein